MKKFNWQRAFGDFKDSHDDLVITQPRDLFHVYGGQVLEWLAEEIEYTYLDSFGKPWIRMIQWINLYLENE